MSDVTTHICRMETGPGETEEAGVFRELHSGNVINILPCFLAFSEISYCDSG